HRVYVEYLCDTRASDVLFPACRYGRKIPFSEVRIGVRAQLYRRKNVVATRGRSRHNGIWERSEFRAYFVFTKILTSRLRTGGDKHLARRRRRRDLGVDSSITRFPSGIG